MISLILPYWDRQPAADQALALLARGYRGLDLEIIVVDDGSPTPFVAPDWVHEDPEVGRAPDPQKPRLRVVRLPAKQEPKSPVTCWNAGVRAARGDLIAISCIEILHHDPVLAQMAEELERQGPDGYVLAAAWCPDLREWHCHSMAASRGAPPVPAGTGRAFLGIMHRGLYERVGGFDEVFREGAGWEDMDFILRMQRAGAKFCIRDDLVVIHTKAGASIAWGREKFARNKAIFDERWSRAHA